MRSMVNRLDDLKGLDRVIHEPARLLVVAHLSVVEGADSTFLVAQTGLTWGNLSSHMTRLDKVGYVEVTKEFVEIWSEVVYEGLKSGGVSLVG